MSRKKNERAAARKAEQASFLQARWPLLAVMAGLLAVVWIAFHPALDNDFVSWDDPTYVTEQPIVTQPDAPRTPSLWRTPVSLNYHPLTMLTLVWNGRSAAHAQAGGLPDAGA